MTDPKQPRPAHRRRRVGGAPGGALSTWPTLGRARHLAADPLRCSSGHRDLRHRDEQRVLPARRLQHPLLRRARARPERRRRLGGPARPRLRGLLRPRRLRLRVPRLAQVRPALADPGDDAARLPRLRRRRRPRQPALTAAVRRLPRDHHALLRPDLLQPRRQPEHHERAQRPDRPRPARLLRPPHHDGPGLLLRRPRPVHGRRVRALAHQPLADGTGVALDARGLDGRRSSWACR